MNNIMDDISCAYCGDKADKSVPPEAFVENIRGDLVCECCIGHKKPNKLGEDWG